MRWASTSTAALKPSALPPSGNSAATRNRRLSAQESLPSKSGQSLTCKSRFVKAFGPRPTPTPESAISFAPPALHHLAQAQDLLVLFQQHCEQEGLEGQGVGGVGGRRQVLVSRGKQLVQSQLVAAPQGAPEASESFLLLQEGLRDGR